MVFSHSNDCVKHTILSKIDFPVGTVIEYVSDIEGNWEYFTSLIERSSVIQFDRIDNGNKGKQNTNNNNIEANNTDDDDDNPTSTCRYGDFDENYSLSLAPNTMLVHGGDSPDKGPGDIRVVKALLQLKRKYPDRVFLICGNRDINKLRFMSELHDTEVNTSTDIYWDPKAPTLSEYRKKNPPPDHTSSEAVASARAVSKLKWILECTMGSQTTFETRRMELNTLKNVGGGDSDVTDDDEVLQSFRDSVNPSGDDPWMLEYLRYGQLMLIIGDCLFVHGGIDDKCLDQVPGRSSSAATATGLESWCVALNQFYSDMILEFENEPFWSQPALSSSSEGDHHGEHQKLKQNCSTRRTRGGELLMDYGLPGGNGGATIVCCSHVVNGNWVRPDRATVQYLVNGGISRLFVGHTPSGDCPGAITVDGATPTRTPTNNDSNVNDEGNTGATISIFACDTSYSDVKAEKISNPANNRGNALSNVFIRKTDTTIRGKLANGETHGYILKVGSKLSTGTSSSQSSLPFSLVGRDLMDGSWVKTIVGDKVMSAKGEGYIISCRKMNVEDVISQLKPL
mmetsp:Transcript_5981/g.8457  ORF Transcript_5981/g.8457 Transcript_5981/m.8457 type:complete len:568 (+) Transcript_5981:250-1953(+)